MVLNHHISDGVVMNVDFKTNNTAMNQQPVNAKGVLQVGSIISFVCGNVSIRKPVFLFSNNRFERCDDDNFYGGSCR